MIKYSLPAGIGYFRIISNLIKILQEHPEWLRNDVQVISTFDAFPNAIWSGGRTKIGQQVSLKNMKNIINFFNKNNIGVNYTYSNSLLEKKHLDDYYCNLTLEIAHNKLNGVIVNSPLLEEYIKNKFPEFKLIGSVTANNKTEDFLQQRLKQVDILVLPPELNKDFELIKKLQPEKLEILVNEKCVTNCPVKNEHYRLIAEGALTYDISRADEFYQNNCLGKNLPFAPMQISAEEVAEIAVKTGAGHFKISGRSLPPAVLIKDFCQYLPKIEFIPDLMFELLKYIW